ncbi:protein plant cadmium resistance 8 [Phtheirospermum japonicum]|uniref:Protein plant cadmium resistance 8 n=1 Tax=Phtheirospermum japonicum TaxID=374723 RepID=A0A830CA16_9LAMI|nr:protein plant cadmium resistance 8 [Phtheirospermum japonicum]
MGRIQGTPEIQTPNNPIGTPNHQMGSYPQNVQSPYIGNPWNSGLFECDKDPTNAVMTALFPCVTFGQIAEVMDASQPSPGASQLSCPFGSCIYLVTMGVCSQCVIGSKYRTRLRMRYGLVEAPYQDAISHLFCPFCSLCQEFRELKSRQLDPALGWQGILAQQQAMQSRNAQINKPPQAQAMSM